MSDNLPPNDLRAELPRAVPFRHVLAGLVVDVEAEPLAFFLEHEPVDALELAAAEAIAPRCRLHVEWAHGTGGTWTAKLFEGDCQVDAWGGHDVSDDAARILAAQLMLTWINRARGPRRRAWSKVTR